MNSKSNYFKLGLFVIGTAVLAVLAILIMGVGTMFEDQPVFETYLNQSVHGVDLGTAVKFRGVPIGNIKSIDFTRTRYESSKPMEKRKPYVRLIISLEQNIFGGSKTPEKTLLEREVERGLRVRMASVGLTGTSYIELDYLDPSLHPPLEMDWTPENGYIPSAGSSFTRIVSSAEEVFRKLENVDILGLVDNINGLFTVAKDKLETTDLASLSGNLDQLLKELRVTNQEIQTMIKDLDLPQISKETQKALTSMQSLFNDPKLMSTIDELHTALENLNQMTGGNQGRIGLVLDNLRILTDNLKTITDNAKNYPSQLLFGEPPPTRKP